MSSVKRDKKKAAQARHMRRMGQKQVRATRAETLAYLSYQTALKKKPPVVTASSGKGFFDK